MTPTPRPLDRTTHTVPARPITILQFGSGNFLRGFADWMVQQSNDAGLTDHGIAIAYATHRADRPAEPLVDQDGLFQVCLEGIRDGRAHRRVDLVDAVQTVIDPYADPEAYQEVALSPDLRVVISNTTEAGIVYVEDDLERRPAPSFPAKIAQLLHDRFDSFGGDPAAGLSIVCCELIEDNGTTLRRMVHQHAARAGWGSDFTTWLDEHNEFCDMLVDRIVSGFPADEADAIAAETGWDDRALVKGELFSLWVIGGGPRLAGLLPLDRLDLGVRFVDRAEVGPFRDKKVRVLNGCHTAMALLGLQLGHETVDQPFGDLDLRAWLQTMIDTEVLPTIDGDAAELREFAAAILERFDNPSLHHRLADISLNSAAKWRSRNLPVVLDRWAAGEGAPLSVTSLAALLVLYARGAANPDFVARDDAEVLVVLREGFAPDDVRGWVSRCLEVLGLDGLPEASRLRDEVTEAVEALLGDGARSVVQGSLESRRR
ncbi:tagaturonate reductase [Mariniluteicoccus flavus]